jgi:hypothetical protein
MRPRIAFVWGALPQATATRQRLWREMICSATSLTSAHDGRECDAGFELKSALRSAPETFRGCAPQPFQL